MSTLHKDTPLSELVQVRSRFARSVHLQRDWEMRTAGSASAGFHLTASVRDLLKAIERAWEKPADRAMSVVGPYGSGKSAACVFLAGLASGRQGERDLLRQNDPALAGALEAEGRRLLPVPLVGSREPLSRALARGLEHALQAATGELLASLRMEWAAVFDAESPTPRQVADLYQAAAQAAVQSGFGGLLLLADELGKYLEHAALHPSEGDIFALQELAEASARSQAPLFVVVVLHQNSEAYAQKLGSAHRAEWAKVGERFREVPFFPSGVEQMDMVGHALDHSSALDLNGSFERLVMLGAQRLPGAMRERFPRMARAAYPLHPLVLLALPSLFRRAGQSHRSLFNFLSGEEAHALGPFLRASQFSPASPPLFMLDALFDYAAEVLLGGWSAGAVARGWAEAVESVERALYLSPLARRVLKCIALLGLLRDPQLPASPEVLEWALADAASTSDEELGVRGALEELEHRRLIVWSRAREVYRLFEGGDVDIEAALEAARAGLGAGTSLRAATERELCPLPRLIARRHSFQTGTLRTVETKPCAASDLPAVLRGSQELAVVLCLAEDEGEEEAARAVAREHVGANVLIAIARESEILRQAAQDVAAAGVVEASTPALQSERASRRELDARRFEAEAAFRDEWNRLFGPSSAEAHWFHRGQSVHFRTARGFSEFLSTLADETFPQAPVLRNELVNRRVLSSAAAAGRRALIEAMLKHPEREHLGIEGFPPERSMYECLLKATGLHRQSEDGSWSFQAPPEDDPARLGEVWKVLEAYVFAEPPAPRPVSDLWRKLAAPPFGLAEGVMPPLLLAFLLANARETTLYRENTFLAEPGIPDWEVLLRRPELFAVAGSRATGERRLLLERLARGLGFEEDEAHVVPVVRRLLKRVRALPPCAWSTRRLSPRTLALREALEKARSPEALLWNDIPRALGFAPPFETPAPDAAQASLLPAESSAPTRLRPFEREAFFEALNGALREWTAFGPQVLEGARDELLRAFGLREGEEGWRDLVEAASRERSQVADPLLVPLLGRATNEEGALGSVLALIANRPWTSWTDADIQGWPARLAPYARAWDSLRQSSQVLARTEGTSTSPGPHAAREVLEPQQGASTSQVRAKLAEDEEVAAQALVKRLRSQMKARDGAPLSASVLQAALLDLLNEVEKRKKSSR